MLKELFNWSGRKTQSEGSSSDDLLETVFHYHAQTKHNFGRYARSLGYMDWANQPNPFRRFEGAPLLPLPFINEDDAHPYDDIYSAASLPAKALSLKTIGQFFELSLALSAWKEHHGTRWALRVNPSSGNLHPTEGYFIAGPSEGDADLPGLGANPMVCHYAPEIHALEVRARFSRQNWSAMMRDFLPGAFLVGLSSIHWREVWKYGERAFRYCQHDVGHALAAFSISASLLGRRLVLLEDLGDQEIAHILGIDREEDFKNVEREHPDLLAAVVPNQQEKTANPTPLGLPEGAADWAIDGIWQGKANRLSQEHVEWEIIDRIAAACEKPSAEVRNCGSAEVGERSAFINPQSPIRNPQSIIPQSAQQIILQRRSAVALDGVTEISAAEFYRILSRTMPEANRVPWNAVVWPPSIHLCMFVHRIRELLPGLYILVRDPNKLDELQSEMKAGFLWEKPPLCPSELPLYFLQEGNCSRLASQVSCSQEIAGDGVFSLGMVAEFERSVREYGPWRYRRLFWETGMIGQVLYLEAEAAGIRGTGIGCYFDDPVHEVFGFEGWKYQSLYHFTMGGPVEDDRLTTLPPYSEELKRRRSSD